MDKYKTLPHRNVLSGIIEYRESQTIMDAPERDVFVRVASLNNKIYLDLGNDQWDAVEITSEGWTIIESANVPVLFTRSTDSGPLPYPVPGGSINELRTFVNGASETNFRLIVSWLLGTLQGSSPYPCLNLMGPQGSLKSTTQRVIKRIVDPARKADICALPRNERDLVIKATGGHLLAFDNVSKVNSEMADAICRLITGAGFKTHQLYTDDQEAIFSGKRQPGLPWPKGGFLEAYEANRDESHAQTLESDPVGAALQDLMEEQHSWSGTCTELLDALNQRGHDQGEQAWPKNASALSDRLRRLQPALANFGIDVGFTRCQSKRTVTLIQRQ